jgi:sulfite reductase alpha subunit-like flavoprotein
MSVPIVMVGPGTGLAPFRAFIKHRALGGVPKGADGAANGEAVLYFGCRHQAKDYLYGATARAARRARPGEHACAEYSLSPCAQARTWRRGPRRGP